MNPYKILIVEDEIIIADLIAHYLQQKGFEVVDIVISFDQATASYRRHLPDLTLLDIRISGLKNGIDVAHFLQQENETHPFVYLTSQLDQATLDQAKQTFPAGYLSKPIQKESLYTTIEVALHNRAKNNSIGIESTTILLKDGEEYTHVPLDQLLYFQADHVYVKSMIRDRKPILTRTPLKELMDALPVDQFIQTHRSFIININAVQRWNNNNVIINDISIPLSRSRRKEVISKLTNLYTG